MSKSKEMLYSFFEKSLRSLSKLNEVNFKSMPKLMTENQFKLYVNNCLKEIISLDGSDQNILTKMSAQLGHLLKSIIDCKEFFGNNIENEYFKKFNEIKNLSTKQQEQFKQAQKLLESMINDASLKKAIEDGLWKTYFEMQKIRDSLPPKSIQESMTSYLYQVQADPLKRAFYIMFTAFFDLWVHQGYVASNGQTKRGEIDTPDEGQNDKIDKLDPVARYGMYTKGNPYIFS